MTRHILWIPWAGPAVALALLFSTVDARPAQATARASVTATAGAADALCISESYQFGQALGEWFNAWEAYELSLPGGTESEILNAAEELDQASNNVLQTGVKLLQCLGKYLE